MQCGFGGLSPTTSFTSQSYKRISIPYCRTATISNVSLVSGKLFKYKSFTAAYASRGWSVSHRETSSAKVWDSELLAGQHHVWSGEGCDHMSC